MRLLRIILSSGIVIGATTGVCTLALTRAYILQQETTLPAINLAQLQGGDTVTTLFARDGTPMAELSTDYRHPVAYQDIPPLVVKAFVSAEDKDFWTHGGVNPAAIGRAALFDLNHQDHRQIGASTITQQVVKNLMLDNSRSIDRKIREALLAIRMEQTLSKTKIMELYLNNIYLGYGAYGLKAAAGVYMPDRPLSSLSVAEAAFLAGLPKGPTNYDPVRHPDEARARRSYVLRRMYEDGIITGQQVETAEAAALPRPRPLDTSGTARGWYQESVRRTLVSQYGKGVYSQGLQVRTNMDPGLQTAANQALQDGLIAYDRRHGWHGTLTHELGQAPDLDAGLPGWKLGYVKAADGSGWSINVDGGRTTMTCRATRSRNSWAGAGPAAGDFVFVTEDGCNLEQTPRVQGSVVIEDARTGRVVAEVGGFANQAGAFDRALQSFRQPGSTLKPFIYLMGFGHGYTADSLVLDVPIALAQGDGSYWRPGGDGDNGWGAITVRQALDNSRNMASVRMVNDYGLDAFSDVVTRFGIYSTPLADFSDALGARETSLLRLTNAYAEIANGGTPLTPSLIDTINGTTVAPQPVRSGSAPAGLADPLALAKLDDVLHTVVTRGTASIAFKDPSSQVRGKTGTSNDIHDAWFVGYRGAMVVGVHVGFDTPQSLGRYEMGGRAAAPIAQAIFAQIPADTTYAPYAPYAARLATDGVSAAAEASAAAGGGPDRAGADQKEDEHDGAADGDTEDGDSAVKADPAQPR